MAWSTTADPQEFLDRVGGFLRERAESNTVALTTVTSLVTRGTGAPGDEAPLFGWWVQDGHPAVIGAFMHTPPLALYLIAPPAHALAPLADLLEQRERSPAGVDASGDLAATFAAVWNSRAGLRAEPMLHTMLYRLGTLCPPPLPTGRAAVASAADADVVIAWVAAFAAELELGAARSAPRVRERIERGAYTLWHDGAGEPVALAGVSHAVEGVRRVGPVYTRPDRRGQGYGAAVTAAACRRALDEGATTLVLFADVDNPISTRLYRRLGFEPLEERRALRFMPLPSAMSIPPTPSPTPDPGSPLPPGPDPSQPTPAPDPGPLPPDPNPRPL